jgi:hydrogenase-4 component F
MGLSPMHTWKPDAYGEAPGMVGALLSGGLTSCAFLCVLRICHVVHIAADDNFANQLLIFMGLLSMATAGVFMSRQRDIKRLLAYSSVEHMGMLAFGIGIGGLAAYGALLHVIHNGLCKVGLFLAAGNIHRAYGSKTTDRVRGVLQRLPWTGWMMVILFFAITGSPLFGPFVSEFLIVCGAFASGHAGFGLAFLSLLLIVFFGMGNVLLNCALGSAPEDSGDLQFRDNLANVLPTALALLLTVVLGLYTPTFLSEWVREAVEFLKRTPID